MKKIVKKQYIYEYIKFDPFNDHKNILPNGIYCNTSSLFAKNYSDESCRFFLVINNKEIEAFDFLVYRNGTLIAHCSPEDFYDEYSIVEV